MPARCQSCQVTNINGLRCHEHGCPDAWRDYTRECDWCEAEFTPEERGQRCCDDGCAASFLGIDLDDDAQDKE